MTESELEAFLGKAMIVNFQPGTYSSIFFPVEHEAPGYITFRIHQNNAAEFFKFHRFAHQELNGVDITVNFIQTDHEKVDLTLIIDKNPALIINLTGLKTNPQGIKWFFAKQPEGTILSLFVQLNMPPATIAEMAALAEAHTAAHTEDPIMIMRWNGTPFGTPPGSSAHL